MAKKKAKAASKKAKATKKARKGNSTGMDGKRRIHYAQSDV